jgi:hypothetical protein
MSSFTRRIGMHKSLHEKKILCIFLLDSHVLRSYIELESTWIHDCPGASNGMSMSRRLTVLVLQERRVSMIEFSSSALMIY